jgi:hypothetical protein
MHTKTFTNTIVAAMLLLVISAGTATAQFKMNHGSIDVYFKTSIGFLQTSKFNKQDYNNAKQNYKGSAPMLVLGIETGLWQNIAVGAFLGYSKFHSDEVIPSSPSEHYTGDITAYNLFVTVKYYTPITFGPIATYVHADFIGLTAYTERRMVLPANAYSLNDPSIGMKENYGIYAGANYKLNDSFGVFGELGYGYTGLNFGINYRIKK